MKFKWVKMRKKCFNSFLDLHIYAIIGNTEPISNNTVCNLLVIILALTQDVFYVDDATIRGLQKHKKRNKIQ